MSDGYAVSDTFRTYYKLFGDVNAPSTPIIVIQGGPGVSHHYMLGLQKLAGTTHCVIFYDQFGSGLSNGKDSPELWNMSTYMEQLNHLRDYLEIASVHLIGHSFGGMLAIDYALSGASGIKKMVLSSTMISMPLYQQQVDALVNALPADAAAAIIAGHHNHDLTSEAYKQASKLFDDRHTYRGNNWPSELSAPEGMRNQELYTKLWGSSEAYTIDGKLKDWDRIDQLSKISVPVLVTAGEYDELTPDQAALTQASIADAQLQIFAGCSHCHHVEDESGYLAAVANFLNPSKQEQQ